MTRSSRRAPVLFFVLVISLVSGCGTAPQPKIEDLHYATVLIEHAKGHGTGAIIGPNAVLTADHVAEGGQLQVSFFKGQAKHGRVRWRDPAHDLALIEVPVPDGYPQSRLFCGDLEAGQHLVSIGHPVHSRWVATGGHLPGTEAFEGELVLLGFPIGLGTSGGPVFDREGRIVGMAQAILAEISSETATFAEFKDTGIGLMLPANVFCGELGAVRELE